MHIDWRGFLKIVCIVIVLALIGCTFSGNAYVIIDVEKNHEVEAFSELALLLEDHNFELTNTIVHKYSTKRRGYIYDPDASASGYYYIDIATEIQKGLVGIRFSEVGKKKLSENGIMLFNKLLLQVQKVFGRSHVSYGFDDIGYKRLREMLFNY